VSTGSNSLRREKELSPKTIKNIHGCFHSALKHATIIGYIKFNPADNAKMPLNEKPQIAPLPEESIPQFMAAIKGDDYEPIYFVALLTGMRQGEILGLTWDCVDFEKGTIYVNKQLQRHLDTGEYILTPLKNDKPRRLSPAPSVLARLRQIEIEQKKNRLKFGAAWNNKMNLVFTTELGDNIKHQVVYKHFKKIAEKIDMPGLRPHDLRHSYAVNALQSGDDIKTVQDALGHYTAAFTLDVYGFVTDKMKKDSAERMEKFFKQYNVQ